MANTIHTVLIVHNLKKTIDYINYSQFFEMVGIFATEYRVLESIDIEDIYQDFDLCLFLSLSVPKELDKKAVRMVSIRTREKTFAGKLKNLLLSLEKNKVIDKETGRVWNDIADVYNSRDLCHTDYNTKYYVYDEDIARDSYMIFSKAEVDIYHYLEQQEIGEIRERYLLLARIHCIKRMRDIAKALKFRDASHAEMLIEELETIQKNDRENAYLYLLMGCFAQTDILLKYEANGYYFKCLEKLKEKSYRSKVYYCLGCSFEENIQDLKQARNCYKRAGEIDKSNFRALYKIGKDKEDLGEKEIEEFQEIGAYLSQFKNCLQPEELEYLYKSHYLQLESIEISCKTNQFFESFYGSKEEGEKFLGKTRLKLLTMKE